MRIFDSSRAGSLGRRHSATGVAGCGAACGDRRCRRRGAGGRGQPGARHHAVRVEEHGCADVRDSLRDRAACGAACRLVAGLASSSRGSARGASQRLERFQNYVVSAFRRTVESPAEAGHYVLHGNGNCSRSLRLVSVHATFAARPNCGHYGPTANTRSSWSSKPLELPVHSALQVNQSGSFDRTSHLRASWQLARTGTLTFGTRTSHVRGA
jgi:hypothetical protein